MGNDNNHEYWDDRPPLPPAKRPRFLHVPPPVEEVIANFDHGNFHTDELDYLYYGGWSIEEYSFEAKAFLANQYAYLWDKVEQEHHDLNKNY